MKKVSLQLKIGLLLFFAVSVVLATGYLSYRSLSSIVNSIHSDAKPDNTLITLKEIATQLEKAENNVRLFLYSNSNRELRIYSGVVKQVNSNIALLQEQNQNTSLSTGIDSLQILINKKYQTWNEMISLYKSVMTENRFKTISDELVKIDTLVQDTLVLAKDTVAIPLPEKKPSNEIVSEDQEESKPGFFARLFGRKENISIEQTYNTQKTDSIVHITSKNNIVPFDHSEVLALIDQMEKEDRDLKVRLKNKEIKLANTNRELTLKFYSLMQGLENAQRKKLEQKAMKADLLAKKTYIWITLFTLAASMLAILVLFTIARYVKKTIAYQQALKISMKEAEDLTKAKELFTANVSHEIRTPLNAMTGFIEQINVNNLDKVNAKKIKIIRSSANHLLSIVNDVLDFSKLEAGKVTFNNKHFYLKDIVEEIYEVFKIKAFDNNSQLLWSINESVPEVLFYDPYRIKQILYNLVSNAVKFTNNGEIEIYIDTENIGGPENLRLIIKDTGIGIHDTKIQEIFEEYVQGEMGVTQKYGGTGLGLSIVKKLLNLMEGEITLESEIGKGTQFTCTLPLREGKAEQVDIVVKSDFIIPGEIKGIRVLVADDEKYNRLLIKQILHKWKIKYDIAENGQEALDLLIKNKYNLGLLDIRMPIMDGKQVLKTLKEKHPDIFSNVPIVAFTAGFTQEEKQSYLKSGFSDIIHKPFAEIELFQLLIKLFIADFEKMENPVTEIKVPSTGKIDIEELKKVAGSDPAFIKEMLQQFMESFQVGLNSISLENGETNYEFIAEIAHRISSPCRHIGAVNLLMMLKEMENICRVHKSQEKLAAIYKSVENEFNEIKVQINAYIKSI